MDGVLSSAERRQLCSLLDLAPNHYGNIPLMKSAYKKACLRLHPDKGGDPTSMMTLNALWHKFTVTITELRSPNFQVSTIFWGMENSLQLALGTTIKRKFIQNPCCIKAKEPTCRCITCSLARQHSKWKTLKNKKCLVWGECLCYRCFLIWFGEAESWDSFDKWQKIILHTDLDLLNLHC
ncbi:Small T antigen [Pumfec polyomavirus LSF128]|nr:Small T antigen [Pumfec polyomavirus LSF128]